MLDTVKNKKTEVVSNVIEPAVFLKRLTRTEITVVKQVICICWQIKKT